MKNSKRQDRQLDDGHYELQIPYSDMRGFGRFSELTASCRAIWAKSGEPHGHGLLAHMLDVAAVAEAIVRRESPQTRAWSAKAFGLSSEAAPRWLAAICGLHDLGKAIPGFQAKWPDGQQADEKAGLRFASAISLKAVRHDLASAVLLRAELAQHFPGSPWIQAVTQALGAHHGYFPRQQEIREAKPIGEGGEWTEARKQLLDTYLAYCSRSNQPLSTKLCYRLLPGWLG